MKIHWNLGATVLILFTALQLGMGRSGQYDEEAREMEHQERLARKQSGQDGGSVNPAKRFAGGIKQATVDSTAGLLSDTAEGTHEDAPIVGTLEGTRKGTEKILDNTVKGVVKVATLGYGEVDHYEVEEPEANTDKPTKITIKIPGT